MADENEEIEDQPEQEQAQEEDTIKEDNLEAGGPPSPPPPPAPPVKQKLYLLEFIVDDINLDFCNTKRLICFGTGTTVIEFSFLDIGPLRITETDFDPVQKRYLEGCTGTGNIKNGKSVLFGLTPEQAEDVAQKTIIYCDFFKKTEKREYKLGSCMIRLINLFKELLELVAEGGKSYYHKTIKDFYKIKDNNNELVGHMYAYIRMSCFNEIIINKFKKDPSAEMDYTPDKGFYQYKYNKPQTKIEEQKGTCECKENKTREGICDCPNECPHQTCPQIYTDNKCIYDCSQTLRPCQECPSTCAANRAAGNVRTNKESYMSSSMSHMSKKSTKSAKSKGSKGGKGGKEGKGKKK